MRKYFLSLMIFCCLLLTTVQAKAASINLSEEYLDKYFTSVAAASCVGVYKPDKSHEFDYLRNYGWQIDTYKGRSEDGAETNYSLAHNYIETLGKHIYIMTFRGSVSKNDWQLNLKTDRVPYGGSDLPTMESLAQRKADRDEPAVHRGFNSYTLSVLKDFVLDESGNFRDLFRKIINDDDVHLILTGHSLGGAVATLLGERLTELGVPKEKFTVISFGAPAVGNNAFAEQYGNKINLLRITNSKDPVPGSLQTFFGGYKQFGEHYVYGVSSKVSSVQHDSAMYFDYSVSEYYKAYDEEIAAGRIAPIPDTYVTEGIPIVAVWMVSGDGSDVIKSVVDSSRFFTGELQAMLPSRIVMSRNLRTDELAAQDYVGVSRESGAEYIFVCELGGSRARTDDYHFMLVNCSLYKSDGRLVFINSWAKKVTPSIGNIHVAGVILSEISKELRKEMPFVALGTAAGASRM